MHKARQLFMHALICACLLALTSCHRSTPAPAIATRRAVKEYGIRYTPSSPFIHVIADSTGDASEYSIDSEKWRRDDNYVWTRQDKGGADTSYKTLWFGNVTIDSQLNLTIFKHDEALFKTYKNDGSIVTRKSNDDVIINYPDGMLRMIYAHGHAIDSWVEVKPDKHVTQWQRFGSGEFREFEGVEPLRATGQFFSTSDITVDDSGTIRLTYPTEHQQILLTSGGKVSEDDITASDK